MNFYHSLESRNSESQPSSHRKLTGLLEGLTHSKMTIGSVFFPMELEFPPLATFSDYKVLVLTQLHRACNKESGRTSLSMH